jgi:RNA polymerase sigma-70 factor (ECF subfamily)
VNEMPTDQELLKRALKRDHEAYADLFRRYAPLVRGVVLASAPQSEVDDAMQEVFILSWRRLGSLRDESAYAPWLATIARRTATSFLRSQLRRLARVRHLMKPAHQPDDAGAVNEILEEIRTLPEAYREPLILRLVEQMSGEQIAEHTGLTTGSVRVNLHRGMKLLRQRLEDMS